MSETSNFVISDFMGSTPNFTGDTGIPNSKEIEVVVVMV